MTRITLKIIAIIAFLVAMLFAVGYDAKATDLKSVSDEDAATTYKAKCAMCHSPKAEKHFDLELADEEHVKIILDGKKAEKPPHMPPYKDKGIDADKAQALVTYMRQLRTPPAE
jgi:cytochrome c553